MIDFNAYEKTEKFCTDNKLPKLYKKLIYYKYVEEMKGLVDSYKNKESSEPNSDILTGFDSSCLSDERLRTNQKLVDDELKEFTSLEVNKLKKNQSTKEFWMSVWAGILASFIFVILAIAIYKVGENQFNSWFGSNGNGTVNEGKAGDKK